MNIISAAVVGSTLALLFLSMATSLFLRRRRARLEHQRAASPEKDASKKEIFQLECTIPSHPKPVYTSDRS